MVFDIGEANMGMRLQQHSSDSARRSYTSEVDNYLASAFSAVNMEIHLSRYPTT